ncbi:T9SS type B sorting domain-containing protein [Hymenobacter rubripertinctus]|nr:gliding motility-associated C-terminal domain-containing protein [Hymenobacter rubripertinctus]
MTTNWRAQGRPATLRPWWHRGRLLALALLLSLSARAQFETSQWYFGNQAGLDFRTGTPVPLTNGLLYSAEGCSSRADSLGNLLLYTNGVTIWNQRHQVMAGGASLRGNTSTTQYLVVAQPGRRGLYYLLSPDKKDETNGFRYSVIDMGRQNGLGEVVQREVPLHPTSSERVAAVPHANGRDLWILGHERATDVFFAYLLTAQGLGASPVLSRDALAPRSVQVIGQLKASPDGRRLAMAIGSLDPQQPAGTPSVELLDFDPATGRLSNPVLLPPARMASYGVEFSPNGRLLYVSDPFSKSIYQYDVTAANVAASALPVPSSAGPDQQGGTPSALQLGPDGRIYVAQSTTVGTTRMGVIIDPDRRGAACAYLPLGVELAGRRSVLGLPSFVQRDLWHFTVRGACQGSLVSFALPTSYGADSVRWHFGDPGAASRNGATGLAATHTYAAVGRYLIKATLYLPGGPPVVLRRYVDIQPRPAVNLGPDTTLCAGQALLLTAPPAAAYRWQDGSTAATLQATLPGWYWVQVTSAAGCTARDSLRLRTRPLPPPAHLGPDTVLCPGVLLTLRARGPSLPDTRYRWSDGSAGPTLTVQATGTYWLETTNAAGCGQRDSIRVRYLTPLALHLGPDTVVCQNPGQPFVLSVALPGGRYRWQDGSTAATFTPTTSGTYRVTVSVAGCSATDSVQVRLPDCRQQVFVPNIITPNHDGLNDRLEITGLGAAAWALTIYNRWGQPVYTTAHYRQDWTAPGLANGVYYYLLEEPGRGRRLKGWLQVSR